MDFRTFDSISCSLIIPLSRDTVCFWNLDKGKYFPKNKQGGEKILANEPGKNNNNTEKVDKLIPNKPDEASGMPKGEGRVRPSQK